MPTAPIIIPLIVAALTVGSLLANQTCKLSKKKLLGVSILAGSLNVANAYLVYTLFPPVAFTRFSGGGFTGGGGSSTFTGGYSGGYQFRGAGGSMDSFLILSFVTGLLIVLAVVGIALLYARHKIEQSEEAGEVKPEEEAEENKLEQQVEEGKLEEDIKET